MARGVVRGVDWGCLPFDGKMQLGCRKHNGKPFTSLPQNCHLRYGLNPKRGEFVKRESGTEKLVNGKQHSVWFVPTGMNRLPQNVLLNFRLEFPKNDLTIYLPFGISEIFCQMVSTLGFPGCWEAISIELLAIGLFGLYVVGRISKEIPLLVISYSAIFTVVLHSVLPFFL